MIRRGQGYDHCAMSDLINPVNGHRGMLIKKGITPKDYMKENRKQIKDIQNINRENNYDKQIEPEPLYKLTQFQNVPSRVFDENNKEPYKQLDGNYLRKGQNQNRHENLTIEARIIRQQLEQKLQEESELNECTLSPRKPPVFLDINKSAPKHEINFIKQNRTDSIKKFEKNNSNKEISNKTASLARHEEFGKVPNYLENRRHQWQLEEQERIANLPDPDCPKGMILMPEKERIETLETLKNSRNEAMKQLSNMPFIIETPSQRKKHDLLENKIKEIESAIALFSRQKVFIAKE